MPESESVCKAHTRPATRPFYLGFTPTCFDDRPAAWDRVYEAVYQHADLLYVSLGAAVPWPEALAQTPYPELVERELRNKRARLRPEVPVYLVIDCLNIFRNGLAPYWRVSSEDPPEGYWLSKAPKAAPGWETKQFDDPEVVTAYTNHCRRMIREFRPKFLTYGSEASLFAAKDQRQFERFLVFLSQVYATLKREHPDLPLLLTFQIDVYHAAPEPQAKAIKQLLPYTDFLTVSTYPHMVGYSPETLPENWFREVAALAPEKPFAIGEAGMIAKPMPRPEEVAKEEFLGSVTGRVWRDGSEEAQAAYVSRMLSEAERLQARFVNWYFIYDFDEAWRKSKDPAMKQFSLHWRDSGLIDSAGRPRKGLQIWDEWLRKPRSV